MLQQETEIILKTMEQLNKEKKHIDAEYGNARERLLKQLDETGTNSAVLDDGEQEILVGRRWEVPRITYDGQGLHKALKKQGVPKSTLDRIFTVTVDEKALDAAYAEGLVDVATVHGHTKINRVLTVQVSRMKREAASKYMD